MRFFTNLIFLFIPIWVFAQVDTIDQAVPEEARQIVEDFLQNTESEGTFDFNTLFERFEEYRKNPINLNTAEENELRELGILSDIQIINLLQYRKDAGELVAIFELQAIPGLDLPTIRTLLPFVTVSGDVDDFQVPLGKMLYQGDNELYLRWSRVLENQKGYTPLAEGESGERYLGDPNQYYVRYRHQYSNRLSFGITAEKDRGEEFFAGSNKKGFDFYSAHLFLRDYNKTIKAIALGDYAISLGQGLLLFSGFNAGKSVTSVSIKRSGRVLNSYRSVNEVQFMRGAATTLAFGNKVELTLFGSYLGKDGNALEPDSSDIDINVRTLTSFDLDGLHRTPGEIADRNVVNQLTLGGSVKYKFENGHLAANALFDRFDADLVRTVRPYNQFYFSGDQLLNISLDYSYIFQNFNFFGETAMSDNGALATLNGLLIGLDRKVDLAILYRNYPRDYQALNASPFAETDGARNENGLYFGLEIRPLKNWKVNTYFDTWQHPWLRFTADAPSRGHEYRARITYYQKRRFDIYVEVRDEIKDRNVSNFETKTNSVIPNRLFQTRFHISNKVSKSLELRSRLDFGFADNDINGFRKGIVLYQDVLYRPVGFPLSFTTRFAIYDTDGFAIRYYAFENGLLNSFSVPPYYNKGTRFYINVRYKGIRNLTVEARYAQTYWQDQETVGSGLEETDRTTRTQVSAQVKYKF